MEKEKSARQRKREKMTPQAMERIRQAGRDVRLREEPSELPAWVKQAVFAHDQLGMTWEEAAKRGNRSPSTLETYAKSPAFKKWRQAVKEAGDPLSAAKKFLGGVAPHVAFEGIMHYEAAKEAGDTAEAGRMIRELGEWSGLKNKTQADGAVSITVTFNTSMEVPEIESEATDVKRGRDVTGLIE